MSLFDHNFDSDRNSYGLHTIGRPFHLLKTAWYCQNGCQMHWMARKPEFKCPICNGEFIEDSKAFLLKHPAPDLGRYAQAATNKYGKTLPSRAKPKPPEEENS